MSIITLDTYKAFAGTPVASTTDATRDAALNAIIADVDAAIRKAVRPFVPVPTTVTNWVTDAPVKSVLTLPLVPVRSITNLYLHWGADGDPSNFDTTADLLTPYSDYWMPIDSPAEGYSRSGRVLRRGTSSWGYEFSRPAARLADQIDPNRGAVMVTFAAGPNSVPDDLALAACLATSMVYQRRLYGMPQTSESWNGYSTAWAAPFLTAVLASPDVAAILGRYQDVHVGVA